MNRIIAVLCMLTCCGLAKTNAQIKDSLPLKEVHIIADRFNYYNQGQAFTHPDSLILKNSTQHSLAEFLSENSAVFIKNYGPGNIATPSFRGTGAEHTAILWNGFNLQSPMLGLVDVSIIPLNLSDEVQIKYGGNGALYGSGAIGGAIHLNSKPNYNAGFHVGLSVFMGSFQTKKQLVNISFSNKNIATSLKFSNQESENNFPFYNRFINGNPLVNLTHAKVSQQSLISETYYRLSSKNEFNFRAWLQQSNRLIPPSMSMNESFASQKDQSLRFTGEWKSKQKNSTLFIRSGAFFDVLNFTDSLKQIESVSHIDNSISEIENTWYLSSRFSLTTGLNATISKVSTASYTNKQNTRLAEITSFKYVSTNQKLNMVLNARFEWMNGNLLPMIPNFGVGYILTNWMVINANINKAYRVPTFNEKYWIPGGNVTLQAESGWGQEMSTDIQLPFKKLSSSISITAFNRNTNNWIQWVPDSNFWRPQNISKVWNRGLEITIKNKFQISQNLYLNHQSIMSFIRSTTELNNADYQLTYIPRITQQHLISLVFKNNFISYTHSYTGMRYIDSKNTLALDDYQIGNIKIGTAISHLKQQLKLNLEINNIWNHSYVVMPDRPMPMRNFLIGLTLSI